MKGVINQWLPPEFRRKRLTWALVGLSVVFAGVTLHASLTQIGPYGQNDSASDRAEVMVRATALATQAMSYNAATAEADIAAAKDTMTAEMQRTYDLTLPPPVDRQKQAKSGVKVDARVARLDRGNVRATCPTSDCAVGVMSMTSERASVLVFVNQYATASSTKNTVINPTWAVMRLARQDGEWMLAGMEAP